MKQNHKRSIARLIVVFMLSVVMAVSFAVTSFAEDAAPAADAKAPAAAEQVDSKFTVGEGEDAVDYDLSDGDSAHKYVDNYADNLEADEGFESHITAAIAKVRESIKTYASFWSLVPPIIAIVLALITKEVYSSLIIGIVVGGVIYAGGNFRTTITHVMSDGFIGSLSDSYNMGIIIFLVLLGALVAMMNKSGSSAAFGRWAKTHIKTRTGTQLATIVLGVLIFIDDYFNCLTVGSVMRPVTDAHKVSRAKLSYIIDATAAPVCIIAPHFIMGCCGCGIRKRCRRRKRNQPFHKRNSLQLLRTSYNCNDALPCILKV